MRLHAFVAAVAMLSASFAARADSYNFVLTAPSNTLATDYASFSIDNAPASYSS